MKVKFTKLAALLLAGVALLAAGCTDYEVDIQEVDKKVDELAVKTAADLESQVNALKAMISAVEQNYKDADAALKKQLEDQIKDLQALVNQKVDQTAFDAYKAETAETLRLLNEAVNQIKENYATKAELEAAVAEVTEKLNDYVLKTTFDEFVKVAATKAELEATKAKLEKDIADLETKLEGEIAEAKAQMIAELEKLNKALEEVNGKIEALDERVTVLENAVADIIDELAFAEGDLQGYIDDADAATLQAAMDYTDEWIDALLEYLDDLMFDVWGYITVLQERMQSIVYVPDYDDLKITVNMAYVSQEVEADDLKPQAQGVNTEKEVAVIDQPFKVQYKFLPAQYAAWVAANFEDLLEYDIKPVNTRAEEEGEDNAPALQILAADYDDDVDETGIVTFTVLPVNVASAQFAANGYKPRYDLDLEILDYYWVYAAKWDDEIGDFGETWPVYGQDPNYPNYHAVSVGVWNYQELMAYEARAAFAASMRLKYNDGAAGIYHYYFDGALDDYVPEYNEIASTYNVLYPDVTEIEILPDPYKPELDENGDPKVDEEGNTVLVKAVPEYQYLPYSSLRENPVGEKEDQDPKGYRIILDQAVPGVEIDGNVYTVEDAAKQGYLLPKITTVFDEFTYDKGTAAEVDEENFVETAKVYAEIEMNPEKSAAVRKLAVGNVITGWYSFNTEMGKTPFYGQVEITKPLGEVDADAEIVWTWEYDAVVDHNIFYETGEEPTIYTRVALPINVNEEQAKALEDNLAVTIDDFSGLEPKNLVIKVADAPEEGAEPEFEALAEDAGFEIANVTIKDGELFADINDFEWDKIYSITAEYELEAALITVNGTLTTIDRNREKVVLGLNEYTFIVNYFDEETGFGYIEDPGYYYWASDGKHAEIFKAFVDNGVINVKENVDFAYNADQEDFNEGELEGHIRMADPSGTAKGYVDINRDEIVAKTLSTLTSSVLAGEIFNSGERDENDPNLWIGNVVTRNITTYIGEEVEIPFKFNIKVPDYNFLHLSYYTFNTEKENAPFIQKYQFADNDGSVLWWTQVNPSYFTEPKGDNETEDEAQQRVSNRYALADYDVSYINLAELAFNIVDDKDEVIEDADLEELGLTAKFIYTDETLGEKELPVVDQIDPDFLLYESLWVDNTVFYYRTNEKKFIPALGTLTLKSGDYDFPVATRFEFPKAAVKYPAEVLDYSTYAMVRWTPFKAPVAKGYTIVLDENKVYSVPLFKGMELQDNRPNNTSFYVIKDGEWVVGNAAADATKASNTNGYLKGVAANDAYHITTTFTYDDLELPADLRKLLSVKYSEDGETFVDEQNEGETLTPYIVFDYTSEVQFRGTVTIPVVVALENPWQETLKFVYDITIKGVE